MAEKHTILLNVAGKKAIEAEFKLVDLSFFHLDLTNPRFNHIKNLESEDDEEKRIWEDKDTKTLCDAILASKGLSEPIIARKDGTVIEGNRRIVCLRKIKEKYGEDSATFPSAGLKKISTYIFPENIDPIEQSIYLARLHVSGKKEWDAFNQAKYIYDLKENHELTFERIAKLLGMSKGKVYQKHWAFIETKKFLDSNPKESTNRYSFFEETYKKNNVKQILEKESSKEEFYKWITEEKLKRALDIRQLSEIIEHPSLLSLFKRKGIADAHLEYKNFYKVKSSKDKKLMSELLALLKNIPREELKKMSKDKDKIAILKDLRNEIDSLLKEL